MQLFLISYVIWLREGGTIGGLRVAILYRLYITYTTIYTIYYYSCQYYIDI